MKKSSFIKLTLPALILLTLTLTSCDQFLSGSDFKSKLEKDISYAQSPSFTILVKPEKGSGTVVKPAMEETVQKVTDTFAIQFDASTGYDFICWKAESQSLKEGEDIDDYLCIENKNSSETSVTFLKELSDIIIKPVVAKRAQIISWSPALSSVFSLRDSPITVVFDRSMNENSIYFTDEEKSELKERLSLKETDFLTSGTHTYAYKKDQNIFFKNILISDAGESINMNKYFTVPVFNADCTSLFIDVDLENLPPEFTQIAVTIERDFFYTAEENGSTKDISLSQEKKWLYSVSNEKDDAAPEIIRALLTVTGEKGEKLSLCESSKYSSFSDIAHLTPFQKGKELTLSLDFMVKDEGVGLKDYFEMVITKVMDANYNSCLEEKERTFTLPLEGNSLFAFYKEDLHILSLYNLNAQTGELSDGMYRIEYHFYDRNNKTQEGSNVSSLFVALDNNLSLERVKDRYRKESHEGVTNITYIHNDYMPNDNDCFPHDIKLLYITCTRNGEDLFYGSTMYEGKNVFFLVGSDGKENGKWGVVGNFNSSNGMSISISEEDLSFTLPQNESPYDFTFYAKDFAGNTASQSVSLKAD